MAVITNNSIRPMGKNALRSVERQRQMAQALQGQSMQPLRGQMAGRVYVPPSPFQGADKLAQMLAGTYVQGQADDRGQEIDDDRSQEFASSMQAYKTNREGQKEVIGREEVIGRPEIHATEPSGDPFSPDSNPYQPATEYQPAVQAQAGIQAQPKIPAMSIQDASMNLIGSKNPTTQKVGYDLLTESLKPKKDERTNFQKNFEARENYSEGSEGWNRLTAKLDKDVNVPSHYEKTYQKERDKHFATNMNNIEIAAQKGHVRMGKINRMQQLLKGVDDSGEFSMIKVGIANFVKSAFGRDIDNKLGAKQAAIGMANELATELRPPASGVMTDADFDHFLESVPSLMTSIDGRRLMADTMRKFVEAEQQIARMATAYEKKNGRLDAGFTQVLTNHFSANPIYKRPENMPDVDSKVSNGTQTYTAIPME